MCDNCQQLQARVATLEAAVRVDTNRFEDCERELVASGGLVKLRPFGRWANEARAALSARPSPVADVVRSAVECERLETELADVCDRRDWAKADDLPLEAARERREKAVSALLVAQPGVWE